MRIKTTLVTFHTKGRTDVVDITDAIQEHLHSTKMQEGNVLIFAQGSTCGITTIEYEPGLVHDIKAFFDRVIPDGMTYQHDERWHDGNGHSHLQASMLGPEVTIPVEEGSLMTGTWQQIFHYEADIKSRHRNIIVTVIGE